mmetsp:Transcript_28477/g.72053  ORF Transcript_28477/g.72053 Transcript_28477/m.72053 type:complete len:371 (+) Transcript_28477:2314-3426(+)
MFEGARSRMRPIVIALDGVDLAVVPYGAEGLRQRPPRHRVRAEAAVPQGILHGVPRVLQILVVLCEMHRLEHAFVDDGLGGERSDVHRVIREFRFGLLASYVEQGLQLLTARGRVTNEDLLRPRLGLSRALSQHCGVHRHDAVAEDLEALVGERVFQSLLGRDSLLWVLGEEQHAHGATTPILGHVDLGGEQLPGDLRHHAGAVTAVIATAELDVAVHAAAASAPVFHAGQGTQGGLEKIVVRGLLHVGDHADATSVLLADDVLCWVDVVPSSASCCGRGCFAAALSPLDGSGEATCGAQGHGEGCRHTTRASATRCSWGRRALRGLDDFVGQRAGQLRCAAEEGDTRGRHTASTWICEERLHCSASKMD